MSVYGYGKDIADEKSRVLTFANRTPRPCNHYKAIIKGEIIIRPFKRVKIVKGENLNYHFYQCPFCPLQIIWPIEKDSGVALINSDLSSVSDRFHQLIKLFRS